MSITAQDHNSEIKKRFINLFGIFEQNLNGKASLAAHKHRQAALDRFNGSDFPSRKDENWKYTSIARIIEPKYQLSIPFELSSSVLDQLPMGNLDAYRVVFANGVFQEQLSNLPGKDLGIFVEPLDLAMKNEQKAKVIEDLRSIPASEAMNTFSALNEAFASNGFFVHVDRKTAVDKPVHFIFVANVESEMLITPRILVNVEDNAECSLIESYHSLNQNAYFINGANHIKVGPNSHLHHYKIQLDNNSAYRINDSVVAQEKDSTYSNYTIDLGAKIVRNNVGASLKDSGTMTNLFGLYLPQEEQHVDNQTFIDHAFPHCNSNELYKGIIKDKGRGVFNGKVLVRQDAQKTNAYQQNSTLVLSNKGVMDTKPQLEIFADDVRCSHGATVGQLDEESVYYLKARGLNDEQARALLQFAFIGEVIENIPSNTIKEVVGELVLAKLRA